MALLYTHVKLCRTHSFCCPDIVLKVVPTNKTTPLTEFAFVEYTLYHAHSCPNFYCVSEAG